MLNSVLVKLVTTHLILDSLQPGGELGQLGEGLAGDQGVPGVIVTKQPITPDLSMSSQSELELESCQSLP